MSSQRARSPRGLLALAGGLLVLTAAIVLWLQDAPAPVQPLALPVLAVALMLLVSELGRLHIEVRRSSVTVTLSDIAVVVALFTLPPGDVVLLRVLACAPVLFWLYRRSGIRLAVNLGNLAAESAVCAAALSVVGGADPASPESWAAALLAVQFSGLLAGLVVTAAIRFDGEHQSRQQVLAGLVEGAWVSALTGFLGVICVVVAAGDGPARWLLLVAVVLGLVVYRGYARMLVRKAALAAVHTFTRRLDATTDTATVLGVMLREVPGLVGARRVTVVQITPTGTVQARLDDDGHVVVEPAGSLDELTAAVVSTGVPAVVSRGDRRRSVRDTLRGREVVDETMVAPLAVEGGATGVLVATDRLAQVRGFRSEDLVLLETLALHAGVALANVGFVDRLRHEVSHDHLTGLLNRVGITAAAALNGEQGVLLLQLGGLQEVRDALGHAAGDTLLEAVADRMRQELRSGSAVGRIDPATFAVLLPGLDADAVVPVAERLLALVTEPVEVVGVPVALSAAVGIAAGGPEDDLVRSAEIALRSAAVTGGGLLVYEPDMQPPSLRRLAIVGELRSVLADPDLRRQVEVWFQPKADTRTGDVHAVEALVRWVHPERGLVPPDDFIPVIEQTSLVRPLTLHVLDVALARAAHWAATGRPLAVAVNISARSLHDPHLVQDVGELLRRHGVPPELLVLEITESAVMDDADAACDMLEQLAATGIALSVDDFGTGYSSLAYLARLPVAEVKIDRSFVSRTTVDRRDAAVVASVINLAHSLGLRVVAEGVEDADTYDHLAQAGVDVAQGYFLSPALPAEALDRWLRQRSALTAPSPRSA